jgi:hypothetical protein
MILICNPLENTSNMWQKILLPIFEREEKKRRRRKTRQQSKAKTRY